MLDNSGLNAIDPDGNLFSHFSSSCNYYTVGEYSNMLYDEVVDGNFRLVNFNIRSFHQNSGPFSVFLSNLEKSPDVLVLSETWNTPSNVALCSIDGYSAFHTYRTAPGARGGGVSVFCKNSYCSSEKLDEFSVCFDYVETCVVRLKVKAHSFIIMGIYRPPSDRTECIDSFFSKITDFLQTTLLQNSYLILFTGDINLDLCGNHSQRFSDYTDIMQSFSFLPAITIPTRLSANHNSNSTNLDHIFINKLTHFTSGVIYLDLTDHCPTFIHFHTIFPNNNGNSKIKIESRPFNQDFLDKLINDLIDYNWSGVIHEQCDLNLATEMFLETIDRLYCKNFPLKIKYISHNRYSKPWITPELKRMTNEKSKMYKLYQLGFISRRTNNSFRNLVNRKTDEVKVNYFKHVFTRYMSDAKKYWKVVREVTGSKPKTTEVETLVMDDQTFTSPADISEIFNNFFSRVASNIDNALPTITTSPLEYMPPPLTNSMFLTRVSPDECMKLISNLKSTYVSKNRMPVNIFKQVACVLVEPICKLLNYSFCRGVFPECLKLAKITPIFKSGDKRNPSNYRPIAGLHYLSKIFERSINNRIVSFFDKFSLLCSNQFGFRSGLNTGDCMLKLLEEIYSCLNERKHLISTFIDLKKAFDTVSHNILLAKLQFYGVRGSVLKLLSSFLTGRNQFVELGGECSSLRENNYGVPQGSILGPTLFLIYINDLFRVPQLSQTQTLLYADDTVITLGHTDLNTLNENVNDELAGVMKWTNANRLCVNSEKSNFMLISNRSNHNIPVTVKLGTDELTECATFKYLGIVLDDQVKFGAHTKYIADKISKNCGIFRKIKKYLPKKTRLQYYYNHVYPYLTYNILVWGGTYNTHLEPVILQQKRAVRILDDLSFTDHTNSSFKANGLLKFMDIYKFQVLVHMYKIKDSPEFSRNHNLNTRYNSALLPSFNRLTLCQHSVTFNGPNFWNSLPQNLKELSTLARFKKHVKDFLLSQY